jgi:hypothetical protein
MNFGKINARMKTIISKLYTRGPKFVQAKRKVNKKFNEILSFRML